MYVILEAEIHEPKDSRDNKDREKRELKRGIFNVDLMESCQLPARFTNSILFGFWSLLWSVSVPRTTCFNVDVEHPLIFTGPQGSYFGAATELVVDKSKWVLVGATKDNFTDNPDIPSPGNVYACPVDFNSETECSVLSSLRTSEANANVSVDAYEEGNQQLGATILVPENPAKPIKICAPNWKNLRFLAIEGYFQTVGNCFHLNNRSDLNSAKLNAFRVKKDDLQYYANPLIGFSIADSTVPVFDTFYGGPNVGQLSTGGMVSMNDGSMSGVEALSLVVEKSDVIKETYLTASLLGYSVATGKLSLPTYIVLGAPGFGNKNGNIGAFSVFLFGPVPSQKKQIEGKQVGSGFGQTICLVDVNGDGIDEILVAAPNWFYDDIPKNQVIHDVGTVYVYYGNSDSSRIIDETPQELKGSLVSFARFGTAIADIGDINKDGFNDVAIGAPFENNEGAVYIFNGKQTRMESMYSQKILGSQLEYGLQGFGFYISRTAKDLDDNTYNDFAVGAYRSDKALILRTRNIVNIRCEISSSPSPIPLNASGMRCSDGRNSNPCFAVSFCFNFTGEGINNTDIDFMITLDANETKQRVEVVGNEGSRDKIEVKEFIIFRNETHCYTAELQVPVIDRNFFQTLEIPIVLMVDYKISNTSEPGKVRAILNRETVPTFSGEVRFDTGCKAEDGTCLSNLNLNVTVDMPRILVGNDTFLRMKTLLRNLGEPSFNTSLIIHYPEEILFNTLTYGPNSERMNCKESSSNTRFCEVLNPFYQRMVGEVDIIFEVSKDAFEMGSGFVSKPSIDINVTATTRNDTYPIDNTVIKMMEVAAFSRVTLQVYTSSEQITASNKSVQFLNTYDFINEGPCVIETANLILYIPVKSKDKVFVKQEDIKVSSKNKKDSCKIIYYPSVELKSTTPNPLPGSSTLKYNDSDTNVILVDRRNYFQPQRDDTGSSQYIFCDDGADTYMCATVECSVNMVNPTDLDSRRFVLSFDMLLNDLPKLEKGKSILTFVTRGQVMPSQRSQAPLVLKSNVSQEAHVSILLPDSFTQDVEEVDLLIIVLGSVGGLLLFLLLGFILWKCGFFKREKRKQVDDFKRKSRYSMRKSRMASVRSGKTGSGSVRSRVPEEERLTKKFDDMDDEHFTT